VMGYPYKFGPIYKEKIWGGRNLERLFARDLPDGALIGESWELADLEEGTSVVCNGPAAGVSLTELTRTLGAELLGDARAQESGRFPLLLKLLDANDILSLQVHPDEDAVGEIGPPAALKTECWYIVESRDGMIYKGVRPGVTAGDFRQAIEAGDVEEMVVRYDVGSDDFHYLPAGTVHALGAGVVVAEVQTPSDTTYRVTDWGRGREIHVERSMQCVHFCPSDERIPGADGGRLLETDYFSVARRHGAEPERIACGGGGQCTAVMVLGGEGPFEFRHAGETEPVVMARSGDTVLVPAGLENSTLVTPPDFNCLLIDLPGEK
jgi:mannose-6-phosphate isomerase